MKNNTPNQASFSIGYRKCRNDSTIKVEEWLKKNLRIVHVGNRQYVVVDNKYSTEDEFISAFKEVLKR